MQGNAVVDTVTPLLDSSYAGRVFCCTPTSEHKVLTASSLC